MYTSVLDRSAFSLRRAGKAVVKALNRAVFNPLGAEIVRKRLAQTLIRQREQPVRQLTSLEEVDALLEEAKAARQISDDALRACFNTFKLKITLDDLPSDPFSFDYRSYQWALYERIAKRKYKLSNESSGFLDASDKNCPFPYYTKSWQTVSDQYLMVGLDHQDNAVAAGSIHIGVWSRLGEYNFRPIRDGLRRYSRGH